MRAAIAAGTVLEVIGPMSELEAAIAVASDDDPAPRLAYARSLSSRGDPLGEFITVQNEYFERRDPREVQALAARSAELLAEHRTEWLGPLAQFDDPKTRTSFDLRWDRGFLWSIALGTHLGSEAAIAIAESPAARFLRVLELYVEDRPPVNPEWDDGSVASDPIVPMVQSGLPATLQSLWFGLFPYAEKNGDLSPVYPSWASLEELHLDVEESTKLGRMTLPRTRILTIAEWTEAHLVELADAELPAVEELILRSSHDLSLIARRFPLEVFPNLRQLSLGRIVSGDDDGVRALADAPWLDRVPALDLSDLLPSDAAKLVIHRARFARLRRLIVSRSSFSDAAAATLRDAFGDRIEFRAAAV